MGKDTLSAKEVVEAISKVYPDKPLAVTVRDLRGWSYEHAGRTVMGANGYPYKYGPRHLIPIEFKVPGKLEFKPAVIDVILRIRELQGHNLKLPRVREILHEELRVGRKRLLCRDCGEDLKAFVPKGSKAEGLCAQCADNVCYNHAI